MELYFKDSSPSILLIASACLLCPTLFAVAFRLLASRTPDLFDKEILKCGAQRGIARIFGIILVALAKPVERGAHGASGLRLSRARSGLTSASCPSRAGTAAASARVLGYSPLAAATGVARPAARCGCGSAGGTSSATHASIGALAQKSLDGRAQHGGIHNIRFGGICPALLLLAAWL